jgi:hypothetical protein
MTDLSPVSDRVSCDEIGRAVGHAASPRDRCLPSTAWFRQASARAIRLAISRCCGPTAVASFHWLSAGDRSLEADAYGLVLTSSLWATTQGAALSGFQWQAGYAAFSVSQSLSRKVEQYIEQQVEHHRRFDFQAEFRKLLEGHGVGYDERYVWD